MISAEQIVEKRNKLYDGLDKEIKARTNARVSFQNYKSLTTRQTMIDNALQQIIDKSIEKGDLDKAIEVIGKMNGFERPSVNGVSEDLEPKKIITKVSQLTGI